MPIYEYRCHQCEKIFEKLWLSPHGQTSLPACPRCGSLDTERILSRPGKVQGEGGRASACGSGSTGFS